MNRFMIKWLAICILELICVATITTLCNSILYWFFETARLSELGNAIPFILGLVITETALSFYCMNQVNKDIYKNDLHKADEKETF